MTNGMVVRRTSYPQVEARASDLVTRAVVVVERGLPVAAAARLARRRGARLLLARVGAGWAGVVPATLERALALGLDAAPLAATLWGAPTVAPTAPEVAVRRALGPGTPFLVVGGPREPVGAVLRQPGPGGALPASAAAALAALEARTERLLRQAGALGAESRCPVAAVGGFARDLLLGRVGAGPRDLDLAVEGDGRPFARRLAALVGGTVREHAAFLTATVTMPGGAGPRAIDVATARRERYRSPGALPVVLPATLAEDLARRDFAVNALAIRLDGAAWGQVLDPTGGLADLERRRVRVLHPLSFVEDPTRVFRAVRFATRLGFRLEPTTRRLLAAAAGLDVYTALSGDRLMAEVEAVLAEPAPAEVLTRLGRAGAFRLVWPGYRFSREAAARVTRAARAARELPLAVPAAAALQVLALGADLPPAALDAWTARWGVPQPLREAVPRARAEGPALARRLARAADAGEAFAALRGEPGGTVAGELTAAWACVVARSARTLRYVADHLGPWRTLPPLLTGDDLKGLGLTPGPRFGRLLASVRRAQLAGRLASRQDAAAWVRETLAGGDDPAHDAANGSKPERKGG